MKQQYKFKTIGMIAAIATFVILVMLSTQAIAQVQNTIPSSPPMLAPLPPGGLHPPANCCPSSGYATAIVDAINHQMNLQGNHTAGNFIHLLKILHLRNIINCPHPGQAPLGQCFLTPRGSISTPFPIPPLPHK
jgi:hypothetical protein